MNFGRMLCSLGLHRVVTTREGKDPGSVKQKKASGAASHIHVFCYRPECKFHAIVDTHTGTKTLFRDGQPVTDGE